MSSTTTSVRLPEALRQRLDQQARRRRVGRNRLVVEALEEFLRGDAETGLREEARRQSLRAGKAETDWAAVAETDAWR